MQNFVIGVVTVIKGFHCEKPFDRFLVVPGGSLVFVSSYLLCESCIVWVIIGSSIVKDIQANRVDCCRFIGGVLLVREMGASRWGQC